MPKHHHDILILGVGAMGSATLYTLARQGLDVCGVEQFGVAHDRGSAHGETRMIRKAYFEHPDYMPLLNRAYELWKSMQAECGETLFVNNGLLLAGPHHSQTIRGLNACYAKHRLPHDRLTAPEAMRRFPQFHLSPEAEVFYDPAAGFLYAEKSVEQMVRLAQRHGAALHVNEKVHGWQADDHGVTLRTNRRTLHAEKLIVTSGAWAKNALAALGVEVQIWRKVLFWYRSSNLEDFGPERFPNFFVETDAGGFYGFPTINTFGMKVGEHTLPDRVEDPEALNRALAPDDEPGILRFLSATFPQLTPRRTKFSVCMYTMTPDEHFILDVHPQHANVVFGAGFSGHGFKFAPVIGEILGELAVQGTTRHPIEFLRLSRFV